MILQKSFFILNNPTRVAAGNAHFFEARKFCDFLASHNFKKNYVTNCTYSKAKKILVVYLKEGCDSCRCGEGRPLSLLINLKTFPTFTFPIFQK
jgi:hypothetical protein